MAELMSVEPISAGLWMPWVLHKVNTLLAALPLTQGWEDKVLTMEMEIKEEDQKQLMNFLISNCRGNTTTSCPPVWPDSAFPRDEKNCKN